MAPLSILAEPWFVIAWYAAGTTAAIWVAIDEDTANTSVPTALKWAWPIIVFFFSIVGLLLYLWCCRPPRIGQYRGEARERAFKRYAGTTGRKVIGSVVHCVGGDGLGIITAMVVARVWRFSFWHEFWFEYAVGFAFGWFIFQYKAMRAMAGSAATALMMGGRAEFFSMMTVMAGMGAVMAYVTPLVVGQQPQPSTAGFWGFGALGLMVGFATTLPMNYWLVKIRWKHGTA